MIGLSFITLPFGISSVPPLINIAANGKMGSYIEIKKWHWLVCQRPLCDIQFVKCVRLSPKTLISQGFAGVSLCETGSLFELFY